MDARLISMIFRDKPGVMYENPPPPSDYILDNFESVSFTYPRPQNVKATYIKIDRNLIHKSLLGYAEKRQEQTFSESLKVNENGISNENVDGIKKTKRTEESSAEVSVNNNALEKISDKKKKKEGKHKNRSKGERRNDIDSDDSKNSKKKKSPLTESSALQFISKSYSMTDSDSDNSEKHNVKSSHHSKSHSKKSSRHKKKHKHSKHDSSFSEVNSNNKVLQKSAKFSVKQEMISSDEENFSSSFSKKCEITLEDGELYDEGDYRKDKTKSSKSSKKKYDLKTHEDVRIHNKETYHPSVSKEAEMSLEEGELSDDDDCIEDKTKSSESSTKKYDDCRNLDNTKINNEDSFSSSILKKTGRTIKEEVLSDDDGYKKNKIKSSKRSKKKYDSRSRKDSESSDDSRIHNEKNFSSSYSKKSVVTAKEEVLSDADDYRKDKMKRSEKKYDSKSRNDSWSSDDSRNRFVDSLSHNDARTYGDSRKNYNDYSSDDDSSRRRDDDSSRRYDDDSNGNRNFNSCMQEIKQEPGSASCYRTSDYYCDVCKLMLNSEITYNTHMAGKRHKKAVKHLSEQEVAKSSVLEITDSLKFPRSADMDRIELPEEESIIQETCDNADLLIVGLNHVREIRGYEDTKFICDLCDAQCVANSIIKHLTGSKHQLNCLQTYCYNSYSWVKDRDKRSRRVEREIKYQLEGIEKTHGRGRIRVFKDVKRKERTPEPFNPYQPGTSRQVLVPPDVPGHKADEPKVTEEECLSREYSDFYCKVCDSHMNNLSMWESHVNGKKHAKTKKKLEESGGINNNFIEAPYGTISHLEEMIEQNCDPNDIIVGLNFIRENRGENGDLYNCFLCGSVSPTIDIIDHLYLKKHKTKYLEKMHSDGYLNAIHDINSLAISDSAREVLVDDECAKLLQELGRGKVVIALAKRTY